MNAYIRQYYQNMCMALMMNTLRCARQIRQNKMNVGVKRMQQANIACCMDRLPFLTVSQILAIDRSGHVIFDWPLKMAASWKKIRGTLSPGNLKRYLTDPRSPWFVMFGLLFAELIVNILVIQKIKCK